MTTIRSLAFLVGAIVLTVPFVGDALKDIQAAETVGAQPILVLTGKGRITQEQGGMPKKTLVFDDLADATRHIIAHA